MYLLCCRHIHINKTVYPVSIELRVHSEKEKSPEESREVPLLINCVTLDSHLIFQLIYQLIKLLEGSQSKMYIKVLQNSKIK